MDGIDPAQISSFLGIDITALTIVSLITNMILPFIVVWYAMYLLLCRIRILRNETVNKVIGAFMSLLTLRFGLLAMWFGFAGILVLKFNSMYDKILSIIIFVLLIGQLPSIFSATGAVAIVCLAFSLVCIGKISNKFMKTIVVVIIFIAYSFASPYLTTADMQLRSII